MDQQHSEDGSEAKDGGKQSSDHVPGSSKAHRTKEDDLTNRTEAMLAATMDINDPFRINPGDNIADSYAQPRNAQSSSSTPIDNKIFMYGSSRMYAATGDQQNDDFLQKIYPDFLEPTPIREGKMKVVKNTEIAVDETDKNRHSHVDRPSKRIKVSSSSPMHKSLSMPSFLDEPHHHISHLPDKSRSLASSPLGGSITTSSPSIDNTFSNTFSMAPQVTRIPPRPLPPDYTPGPYDVICGRGKTIKGYPGNVSFRSAVQQALSEYSQVTSKIEKTIIVSRIIEGVRTKGGSFIRSSSALKSKSKSKGQSPKTKAGRLPTEVASKVAESTWYEVGDTLAREKTGQAFRDCLDEMYRSSTKAKRRRQREEKISTKGDDIGSKETKKTRTKKKSPPRLRRVNTDQVNRDESILPPVVSSGTILTERHIADKTSLVSNPSTTLQRLNREREMDRLVLSNEAINMILDGVHAELERFSLAESEEGGGDGSVPQDDIEDGEETDDSNVLDLFMDSSRMILNEIKSDPAIQERVHQIAAASHKTSSSEA